MNEQRCELPTMFRYTWPGEAAERHVCFAHAVQVVQIAQAMGFHLAVHRLTDHEVLANHLCSAAPIETDEDGAK